MAANTLTCGAFTAWPPFGAGTSWRLTCSELPGWEEWVDSEAVARRAIIDLQAHFRGTWGEKEPRLATLAEGSR